MKRLNIFILSCCMAWPVPATVVTFSWPVSGHGSDDVIRLDAPASTGLNGGIYVAPSVSGLRIEASSSDPSGVKWHKFTTAGAAYAIGLPTSGHNGASSWLDNPEGNTGYAIEDGNTVTYLWLVDHSAYPLVFSDLSESSDEGDCQTMVLDFSGSADEIAYHGINGQRNTLSRGINLCYDTLTLDESRDQYTVTHTNATLDHISKTVRIPSPLCATTFTLSGDRFLAEWGKPVTYTSRLIYPKSVSAHTKVTVVTSQADNETSSPANGNLGGSAPCTITFSAVVSDAVVFHEWQFSPSPDFREISFREQETSSTHTFDERGTTYVRLYCTNEDATCEYISEIYTVSIGESSLKCPNAFTPFNQDGVNDEWKVSYSSIIEFECHIFNRHGRKITSLSDPAQGWDGRQGGKFVPPGTYYYVIRARGADGRDYRLSGDINILDHR